VGRYFFLYLIDGRKPQKKNEAKLKQQLKQIEGMYAPDEEEEKNESGPVDVNSYEHKLMQKRVRAIQTTDEGIFNFNKKPKLSNNTDFLMTPTRTIEPRTPYVDYNSLLLILKFHFINVELDLETSSKHQPKGISMNQELLIVLHSMQTYLNKYLC
jgi:hypothetical protein